MSSVIFSPSFSPSSLPFIAAGSQSRLNNIVTLPKFKESTILFSGSVLSQVQRRDAITVRAAARDLTDIVSLALEYFVINRINDIVSPNVIGADVVGVVREELVNAPPKPLTTITIRKLSMTVPQSIKKTINNSTVYPAKTFILETEEALVALVLMPGVTAEEDVEHVLMNDSIVLGPKEVAGGEPFTKPVYIARIDLNGPDRFNLDQCAKIFVEEGVLKVTIQKKRSA